MSYAQIDQDYAGQKAEANRKADEVRYTARDMIEAHYSSSGMGSLFPEIAAVEPYLWESEAD